MSCGPPRNPVEGQEWKSGRDRYRFQSGKGWVDERLYKKSAPAAPKIEQSAKAEPFRGVVVGKATGNDPDAATGCADDQTFIDVTPEAARKALAAHAGVNLCACGAAIGPKSKECKACYTLRQKAAARPKPEERHCAGPGCGKVLSVGAKTGLCKSCWHADQAAKRPPKPVVPPKPPRFRPDPAEAERVRRAADLVDRNASRRAEQLEDEQRRAIEQAARVVVKVPSSVQRPADPLAKRAKPKPVTADPLDSDAFRAQLARVAAGAGIVTVQRVSNREGLGAATGSSLTNF